MQQKENCLHPGQLLVDTRQKSQRIQITRGCQGMYGCLQQAGTKSKLKTQVPRLVRLELALCEEGPHAFKHPNHQFTTQCLWHSQQGRHSCWSAIQKELREVYLQRSTSQENTEGRGSSASVDQQLISSCLSFLLFSCSWFCWIFSLLTSITFSFIDNMLRPEMIASTGG